jgi:hypothetical protein
MRVLRAALREVLGLFVDDGSLAVAVVAWVVACAAGLRWLDPDPALLALALLLGLAAVLAENVRRAAREGTRR